MNDPIEYANLKYEPEGDLDVGKVLERWRELEE